MIPVEDHKILKGSKYCILVIDMHEGHLGPNATVPVPNGRKVLAPLENFLTNARTLNVPIIHIMLKARGGAIDTKGNPFWHSANVLRDRPRIAQHNIDGSEQTKLVIKPAQGDFLIDTKKRYSCFYGTDLEILLRSLGVDSVMITGLTADVCVMNTAFEAFNRDLKVLVISDCTETVYPEDKEAALRIMSRRLGWVVTSEEALELIKPTSAKDTMAVALPH